MRNAAVATAGWTAFVVGVALFGMPFDTTADWYWSHGLLECMRLVGRSVECEARQETINDAWWWFHLLPIYLMALAGYVAIAALWARATLVRRRREGSQGGFGDRPRQTHVLK